MQKFLEMDLRTQNELNAYCGSLKGTGKQQYIECSWVNTKRVLHHGIWYENGTKNINQVEVIHTGPE